MLDLLGADLLGCNDFAPKALYLFLSEAVVSSLLVPFFMCDVRLCFDAMVL